ncbi:2-iminoacetate synthase ThiH [Desulfomarina sp.]
MTFLTTINEYASFDFDEYFRNVTGNEVRQSLDRTNLTTGDLLNLLSAPAADFLEEMAMKSQRLTRRFFGRTISLYAPLYISDYCSNHCTYCGFNCTRPFSRKQLSLAEIEREAAIIAASGIRHILVLTGEAPDKTPISYLQDAITVLKRYFASIALEIFPMDEKDYRVLHRAGADSLTVYQEVYDRNIYMKVHKSGKKRNYEYRLLTPERGAGAGFRAINIGPLFGLGQVRSEAFFAALHARFLQQSFPEVEISLSLPRINGKGGRPGNSLSDKQFVQTMLAWRLFLPRLGITISTREAPAFRDKLLHLGATRFSAGSRTDVGGYGQPGSSTVQFDITDERSVEEITEMICENGYQPVFKDWEPLQ